MGITPHGDFQGEPPVLHADKSAGKSPLDVAEIRAAFVQSEALPEKIRRFREGRLGSILAGETPVMLMEGPLIVLHLVPVPAFHSQRQIGLLPFFDGRFHLPPIGASGFNSRLNIDGLVTSSGHEATGVPLYDYTQLFRHGTIEAVEAGLLSTHDERNTAIPAIEFEREIVHVVTAYFKAYRESGIDPPVVVMLSLLHVRGFYMHVDRYMSRAVHRIDRQHVIIPEIVVEDLSQPIPTILRPVFDMAWQASGYRRSLNYSEEGNWKGW